jgi:hypothetical protein
MSTTPMSTTPMLTKQVVSGRTFAAIAKSGHIKEPPVACRPTGKRWGQKGYRYVDSDRHTFTWRGRKFTVSYMTGCFFPFLYEQFGGDPQ